MAKRTKLVVFVSKDVMEKPSELFKAAFKHMQDKDRAAIEAGEKEPVGPEKRQNFMREFMKAEKHGEDGLKVIHDWIQVRDILTFKLPKKKEPVPDPEEEEGVSLDIKDE